MYVGIYIYKQIEIFFIYVINLKVEQRELNIYYLYNMQHFPALEDYTITHYEKRYKYKCRIVITWDSMHLNLSKKIIFIFLNSLEKKYYFKLIDKNYFTMR